MYLVASAPHKYTQLLPTLLLQHVLLFCISWPWAFEKLLQIDNYLAVKSFRVS